MEQNLVESFLSAFHFPVLRLPINALKVRQRGTQRLSEGYYCDSLTALHIRYTVNSYIFANILENRSFVKQIGLVTAVFLHNLFRVPISDYETQQNSNNQRKNQSITSTHNREQ